MNADKSIQLNTRYLASFRERGRKKSWCPQKAKSRIFPSNFLFVNPLTRCTFSLGSNKACQIMSNILKANNSDTGFQHSKKAMQDTVSWKSTVPAPQSPVPSSSSTSDQKDTATGSIPDTLPTDAEAAALITNLSAGMRLIGQTNAIPQDDTMALTPDSQNAIDAPSAVEEPETRLRSRSRSTPPSGNGSEHEQDKAPITQRRGNKSNPFARLSTQPRWHNQSYMLFLALRQHPDRCLPRTELIKAALAMDKKISDELKLPKVFRGKVKTSNKFLIF